MSNALRVHRPDQAMPYHEWALTFELPVLVEATFEFTFHNWLRWKLLFFCNRFAAWTRWDVEEAGQCTLIGISFVVDEIDWLVRLARKHGGYYSVHFGIVLWMPEWWGDGFWPIDPYFYWD